MTPEYGAASQLEKIDMLDHADVVAINKFERRGAEDARRDVARQLVRNRQAFGASWEDMPVFGTSAARFNDDGVTALYQHLRGLLVEKGLARRRRRAARVVTTKTSTGLTCVLPTAASATSPRSRQRPRLPRTRPTSRPRSPGSRQHLHDRPRPGRRTTAELDALLDGHRGRPRGRRRCSTPGPPGVEEYAGDELVYTVRGKEIHTPLTPRDALGQQGPARRAAPHAPTTASWSASCAARTCRATSPSPPASSRSSGRARRRPGCSPARATRSAPTSASRCCPSGQPATRLSTAFDSVTLYGRDPDLRPDIYGKVGTSGVSIATLDDMKVLYDGFDLCSPTTSVSMTINGPAPTILAMFLNTAIDQRLDRFRAEEGREPDAAEAEELRAWVLQNVRGTVQADILKEDQGQNTCIFSTEFALRAMADIQQWFVEHKVQNFYSVSISGYHIAEAGANPISQLAFTLANGFTYVEAYLARGMRIDDFAPNLSFFFSNGMDAEYTVIGRVARRIWAVAMKEKYGASERSQKLKYHVQTSGRSLHAQEMAFNDIRTTLQALCALYDNANSLHTNAYDEAVTTPTEESVRRALAIQMIIDQEWGLSANENPLQGSYVVDELTDLVEAGGARRVRPDRRARRRARRDGDRLPARPDPGRVDALRAQEARRLAADHRRQHLPRAEDRRRAAAPVELARATEAEKQSQLDRLHAFHDRAPRRGAGRPGRPAAGRHRRAATSSRR